MARILVVDDDPDLRGLVDFRLRKAGHQVLTALDGPSALALVAARGRPDLAVLDIVMPGMNGLELLRELRGGDGMADLPAIFLSARILPADIEAGRALGATYLTKPFVAPALMAAVDAALNPRTPRDSWAAAGTPAPAASVDLRPQDEARPVAPQRPRTLTSRPPPGY